MALTTIFVHVDDFCKQYRTYEQQRSLGVDQIDPRKNKCGMSLSELMTLFIYYGVCSTDFKHFKAFYKHKHDELKRAMPGLLSYGRLIEMKEKIQLPLAMFLLSKFVPCTGKSYCDSTRILACHIKREYKHKVLQGIATKGKTSDGWFYGTKLHLVVNEYSEIVTCLLTPGNIADNNASVLKRMEQRLHRKLFGDKGYIINQDLWHELYAAGIQIIHGIRANMLNKLMLFTDKLLLGKRASIVESPFSMLNDRMSLRFTKNRSIYGFLCNCLIMLIAYQLWANDRRCIREHRQSSLSSLVKTPLLNP